MKTLLSAAMLCLFTLSLPAQELVDWTSLDLNSPANMYTRTLSVVDADTIWGALSSDLSLANRAFRTTDGGQNFEVISLPFAGFGVLVFDIYALDAQTAYTASTSSTGGQVGGIHRTTDGGQSWQEVFSNAAENFTSLKVYFFNASEGFIYGFESALFQVGFYYTEDGGDSWVKSQSQFSFDGIWTEGGNDGFMVVGDTAWCSNVGNKIFRSTDKGQSWQSFGLPGSNMNISDIAFKDANHGLAISSVNNAGFDSPNALYRTDDGGSTWTALAMSNTMDANVMAYVPGTPGGYIVTSGDEPLDDKFLFTTDDGDSWQQGIATATLTTAIFLSPTLGYGGSNTSEGGLLKYNDDIFSPATAIEEADVLHNGLEVYPNPVTHTLQVSLKADWQEANVQIFNLLGQLFLSTKVDQLNSSQMLDLDVQALPKGLYVVQLSNGKQRVSAKFVKDEE